MTSQLQLINHLYKSIDTDPDSLKDPEVAHLVINHNEVLGMNSVPGLTLATNFSSPESAYLILPSFGMTSVIDLSVSLNPAPGHEQLLDLANNPGEKQRHGDRQYQSGQHFGNDVKRPGLEDGMAEALR